MKKILSFSLIIITLLTLCACKMEPAPTPEWMQEPAIKDYIDFRNEAEEVTVEQAQVTLADPEVEKTDPEYRQAIYTVNEAVLDETIEEARKEGEQTEQLNTFFGGIQFYFIEGDAPKSEAVKGRLIKRGTYTKNEQTGLYVFEFYDRTLAQAAVNLKDSHSLDEYTEVLELLLEDPNIVVVPLDKAAE